MDEAEDDPELGAAFETGAAAGFDLDQGACRGLECRDLGLEVLIHGRVQTLAYPIRAVELFILGMPPGCVVHYAGNDPK